MKKLFQTLLVCLLMGGWGSVTTAQTIPRFNPHERVVTIPALAGEGHWQLIVLNSWLSATTFPFFVVFVMEPTTPARESVEQELWNLVTTWKQSSAFKPYTSSILVIDWSQPRTAQLRVSELWQTEFEQKREMVVPFMDTYQDWLEQHPGDLFGAIMRLSQSVDCELSEQTKIVASENCEEKIVYVADASEEAQETGCSSKSYFAGVLIGITILLLIINFATTHD